MNDQVLKDMDGGGARGVRGVRMLLKRCEMTVFSGNSEFTKQENRRGQVREGERRRHTAPPGEVIPFLFFSP